MEHIRTFHDLPYEDASTPEEMYGDCAAAGTRLRVPAPRRLERTHAPALGDLPDHRVVVDAAAAELARRFLERD